MSTELNVIPSSALTEQEQADLNASVDSIIAAHKNNRQEINRLVFESVSAMTDSEGYEQELSSRKGLRRFWGAITGSNKRLQDKINSSRAAAQFAAQTTLQRLSEQNLLTFDLITAVNNKLNASMTAVEGEINQIYAALIQFFKQNRSDMIQLENRVAKLEQNVNLLNWQNSIEYQMLDDVEYVDLDDASKIVCMVRDFYDITGGEWRTSDLLLLKTVMSTIDISPRGNIRYYDFIVRVAGDEKLLTKLLGGKHIQRLPETYLVPLLGIKKLELLDTDEAYIKEQFIKKSGMLEIVNFSESIEDIGGLENLKDWLYRKAFIFRELDKAIKFGVDVPKGIMIIGMPGCGKSLTAKATASLFEIPLVRLDVGRLLGKYVGESEENMRNALKLSEAISPCVLWIDEIEKAFAGVGGEGGGNDVTTRLFGQFLTWMQEKENTVFIVATANDISRLPPEFLRKGRFDELFFVDLPNGTERRKILEIHLKKRKKWNENIDSIALIKETEGYNGADLEAVVKDTIERAFIEGRTTITTADLIRSIKDTKSISCTLKDKIASIQKTVEKIDIKPASLDDKKEKEPDPSQVYMKAAKAKV